MKIAITTLGPDLNSQVSPVFGRAPFFLFFDLKTEKVKPIPNPALQAGRGAGIAASQMVVSEGAKVVISGNFGPNAFSVLQMSKVKLYPAFGLTARQAIDKYKNGKLKEMTVPTVPPGFGFPGRRGFGPGPRRRRRRRRHRGGR